MFAPKNTSVKIPFYQFRTRHHKYLFQEHTKKKTAKECTKHDQLSPKILKLKLKTYFCDTKPMTMVTRISSWRRDQYHFLATYHHPLSFTTDSQDHQKMTYLSQSFLHSFFYRLKKKKSFSRRHLSSHFDFQSANAEFIDRSMSFAFVCAPKVLFNPSQSLFLCLFRRYALCFSIQLFRNSIHYPHLYIFTSSLMS